MNIENDEKKDSIEVFLISSKACFGFQIDNSRGLEFISKIKYYVCVLQNNMSVQFSLTFV